MQIDAIYVEKLILEKLVRTARKISTMRMSPLSIFVKPVLIKCISIHIEIIIGLGGVKK